MFLSEIFEINFRKDCPKKKNDEFNEDKALQILQVCFASNG